MKRTILSLTIIAGLGLAACSGNDKPEKDASIAPVPTTVSEVPTIAADTTTPAQLKAGAVDQQVITGSKTVSAAPAAVNVAPAAGGAAGLNPPHGQPGHKCEIAVGAPLTSAPTVSTTTPQIKTTTATPSAPVTIPSAGGNGNAKLNPPHGQPGHDCAVQVGAPLKN